jgi:ABC-type transporter Mla maintaining outer membrane lipid asymmetry ATPase subunit MlaF
MKSQTGLAISYMRKTARHDFFVGVPGGAVSRVHLPDDDAKAHLVTAVLKAKCEPGEELELFGEPVMQLTPPARERMRRRVAALSPVVGLMTNLNAWENIALAATYHGSAPLERVAGVTQEVLQSFGIESRAFLARLPDDLGMLERKIAAFVRLLIAEPELSLIDALEEGLSRAECARVAAFETELRARLPAATLVFIDSREEDA